MDASAQIAIEYASLDLNLHWRKYGFFRKHIWECEAGQGEKIMLKRFFRNSWLRPDWRRGASGLRLVPRGCRRSAKRSREAWDCPQGCGLHCGRNLSLSPCSSTPNGRRPRINWADLALLEMPLKNNNNTLTALKTSEVLHERLKQGQIADGNESGDDRWLKQAYEAS